MSRGTIRTILIYRRDNDVGRASRAGPASGTTARMCKAIAGLIAIFLALWNVGAPAVWAQAAVKVPPRPATRVVIVSSRRPPEDRNRVSLARYGITRDDFDQITNELSTVEATVPLRAVAYEARYGESSVDACVVGTTAELAPSYPLELAHGRFLTSKDVKNLNNVAVLAADAARRLFLYENPVGKNIRIEGHYFLIVGVTQPHERPAHGPEFPAGPEIYLPLTTMRSRFGDQVITTESGSFQAEAYELSEIRLTIRSEDDATAIAEVISRLLRARHEADDYSIEIPAR